MARRPSNTSDGMGFGAGGSDKMRDFGFSGSIGERRLPHSPMPKSDFSVTRDRFAYDEAGARNPTPSGKNNTTYYRADPGDFPDGSPGPRLKGSPMPGPKIREDTGDGERFSPVNKVNLDAYAKGGPVRSDIAQDKALVKKGIHQHEAQEHGGKLSKLDLRRGGKVGKSKAPSRARKHASKPKAPAMDDGGMSKGMPINRPPRNPNVTASPKNAMPGGVMPYGVQPSTEPDVPPASGGVPSAGALSRLKRGSKSGPS